MKAISILALLMLGLGLFAGGSAFLNACLIPIDLPNNDPGHSSLVCPTRKGILLSTADGIYQQGPSRKFDKLPLNAKYPNVFDTREGVFILTEDRFYHFIARKELETVLDEEKRRKFKKLKEISENVFLFLTDLITSSVEILQLEEGRVVDHRWEDEGLCTTSGSDDVAEFLTDEVIKLEKEEISYQSWEDENLCTMSGWEHKITNLPMFFQTKDTLCKLKDGRLHVVKLPDDDRLLDGAAETSHGMFLWGPGKVYRLDKDNSAQKIADISKDRVTIRRFYNTSLNHELGRDHGLGRVFVATTNGLFAYSQAGGLIRIPGDEPGVIHSVHEIQSDLYVLASKGVFHLSEAEGLKRISEKDKNIQSQIRLIQAGYKTNEGVFFISDNNKTFRLMDNERILPVSLPARTEKPRDIKDTRVGPLLATDRALYRFSETNGWVLVASGDLGGDIRITPIPKIEGVAADIPVFVETQKGVFAWIESPFDIKSPRAAWNYIVFFLNQPRAAWNYIVIFWNQVGFILLGLLVILFGFVHYSLYSYRWVCYYILGLVAPSRVHNQIFINYRSDDTGGYALALYNELCRRFDRELIFFDRAEGEIDYGDKLPDKIHDAVEQCTVLLALIGSRWLDAQKDNGSRRLDDPDDYVRQEIALALERDKQVIPVLLGNVSMPKADSLPEPLKPFSRILGMNLKVTEKTPSIEAGVDELARRLVTFPNIPPAKRSWIVFQMWR